MHDFLTMVVGGGFRDRDPDDTDEVADLSRHIGDGSAGFVPGVKTGAFPRQLSKLARGGGGPLRKTRRRPRTMLRRGRILGGTERNSSHQPPQNWAGT